MYLCNHYSFYIATFLGYCKLVSAVNPLDRGCCINLASLEFVRRVWLCPSSSSSTLQFVSLYSSWRNQATQLGAGCVLCHTVIFTETGLPWVLTILLKQIIHYPENQALFWLYITVASVILNLGGNYVLRLAVCKFFCFKYCHIQWKRQFGLIPWSTIANFVCNFECFLITCFTAKVFLTAKDCLRSLFSGI